MLRAETCATHSLVPYGLGPKPHSRDFIKTLQRPPLLTASLRSLCPAHPALQPSPARTFPRWDLVTNRPVQDVAHCLKLPLCPRPSSDSCLASVVVLPAGFPFGAASSSAGLPSPPSLHLCRPPRSRIPGLPWPYKQPQAGQVRGNAEVPGGAEGQPHLHGRLRTRSEGCF